MNMLLSKGYSPYKGRDYDPERDVKVYRNLHRADWSIVQDGLVVGHAFDVVIWAPKFKVSEAGRQRVIREGRKNVHAFVVGRLGAVCGIPSPDSFAGRKRKRVSYNPYRNSTFRVRYHEDYETEIHYAGWAHMDSEGKAWAIGARVNLSAL